MSIITVEIDGSGNYTTIAAALAAAVDGDTIELGAGTHELASQLTITKDVTIQGAGLGETIIKQTGAPSGSEARTVQISASNVTIEDLTFAGWTNPTTQANAGNGYLVWNTGNGTTFDNVGFDADNIRVALYIGTSNDITVTHSEFTGDLYRYAIRGAGEHMQITDNVFDTAHYQGGQIYMEYGAATSGVISGNVFEHKVGVSTFLEANGSFQSDGSLADTIINWQPNKITADGLTIENNTFHFVNADARQENTGDAPQPVAIFNDPLVPAGGPITISGNVFQGYDYDPAPLALPVAVDDSHAGKALQFDGSETYASFVLDNDIGHQGTLSVWVDLDSDATGKRNQILEGPGDGGLEFQYRNNTGGQFYGSPNGSDSNNYAIQNGGAAVGATSWTNVQYVWDFVSPGNGYMKVYINGTEVTYLSAAFDSALSTWQDALSTGGGTFYLGRDPGDASRMFDGRMDELAIFNTALSQGDLDQVRTDSNSVNTTSFTSLQALWTFDSVTGDAIASEGGTNVQLELHSLKDSIDPAVVVVNGGTAGATVTGNSFDGDGTALRVDGDVSAEGNWWNTTDPQGIADRIDGDADYSVFLQSGVDTSIAAGFQPEGVIVGTSGDNDLTGTPDADTIFGLAGNDTITGGGANDSIDGGTGIDTAVYTGTVSITATETGFSVDGGVTDGIDTLDDVEVVIDGAGARTLLVGNGGYATIQDAIAAAASGDTIFLAPGTYDGIIDIHDKNLTITSGNAGKAPADWLPGSAVVVDRIATDATLTVDGIHVNATHIGAGFVNGGTWEAIGFVGDSTETLTVANSMLSIDAGGAPDALQGFGLDITYNTGDITVANTVIGPFVGGFQDSTVSNYGAWINGSLSTDRDITITNNTFDLETPKQIALAFDGQVGGPQIDVSGNDFGPVGTAPGAVRVFDSGDDLNGPQDYSGVTGNTFADPPGTHGLMTNETNFEATGLGVTVTFGSATYSDTSHYDTVVDATDASTGQTLTASAGNDLVNGSAFADTITGGGGNDVLQGGGGIDTAVYTGAAAITASGTGWTVTAPDQGTDTLSNIEQVDDAAAGKVLLVGNGGYGTIQAALADASTGDTIHIAAGTYTGNVIINVNDLTIVADDGAVLEGTFRTDNTVPDQPARSIGETESVADYLFRTTAYNGNSGAGITVAANGVTIDGLTVQNYLYGIALGNGTDHTSLQDVTVDGTVQGIRKGSADAVSNLSITGGTISDSYEGMDFSKAEGSSGDLNGFTVDGTSFEHLTQKGIYVETLTDASIKNITMNDVGQLGRGAAFGGGGTFGTGIDINLKWDHDGASDPTNADDNAPYSNIVIDGFTFTNVGSDSLGSAFSVKARDDAPSYGGGSHESASFDGAVIIKNGTIDGSAVGIQAGEPAKATPADNVTGPDVHVENVAVTGVGAIDVNNVSKSTVTVDMADTDHTFVAGTSSTATGIIVVHGTGGDDSITTGLGNDTITGNGGNDVINGGGGTDTAIYNQAASTLQVTAVGGGWTVGTTGEGTDTLSNVEILQGSGNSHVLLVGNGGYASIEAAINAAVNGDTIEVAAGHWTLPGGDSGKNLTFLGANAGVDANGGDRGSETIIDGAGDFRFGGSSGTFDGFTFTGQQFDSYVDGANISLRNNVITNPGQTVLYVLGSPDNVQFAGNHVSGVTSSAGNLDAIFIAGDWNGSTGTQVDISHNVFDGSAGVSGFNLSSVHGTIADNVIDGLSYYGFLLANDTDVSVTGNTFQNIVNPDPTVLTWGAGVRTYTPGSEFGLNLDHNTFTNNAVGLGIRSDSDIDPAAITVTDNTFTGAGNAIVNQGVATTDVTLAGSNSVNGVLLSGATDGELLTIANSIVDGVDLTGAGSVVLKDGQVYLTATSFVSPLTTEPSLQRALDTAHAGDTVHVGAGSYSGNATTAVDNLTITAPEAATGLAVTLGTGVVGITLQGDSDIDVTGNGLANVITGNAGDNVIDGQGGGDTMTGGDGNDTYVVDDGSDTVIESLNEGTDTVQSSVTHALEANVENLELTGTANIDGTGNELANTITGNSGDNVLHGGGGDDTLIGGGGTDTAQYSDAATIVASGGGWTVSTDSEGSDTLSGVEVVDDSGAHNTLLVGNGAFATIQEAINAAADGDTILIANGNYTEALSIVGKALTLQEAAGQTVILTAPSNSNAVTLSGDFDHGDVSIQGIEIVGAAALPNQGIGVYVAEGANVGTLTLNDMYIHGAGSYGVFLDGDDRSVGGREAAGAVVITNSTFANNGYNGANGSASIKLFGFSGDATIQHVTIANAAPGTPLEQQPDYGIELTGTVNSVLGTTPTVTMGSVIIDDVTMTGLLHKNGFAVYNYASIDGLSIGAGDLDLSSLVTNWGPVFNIDGILDDVDASGYGVLLPANVIATELQGDNLGQPATDQTITGTDSWDRLIGKGGDDHLIGGAGNDELYGHDKPGEAQINDAGKDWLEGGSGNDYLSGGAGDDRLDGGTGNDTMIGGTGDDTYVVDSASDVVTEASDEGTDTVESSINYILGANVENLTLTGSADLIGTGNGLNNTITGNSGSNTLDGQAGDDTIRGGDGDDQLFGGADNDVLYGEAGQDFLAGSTGNDRLDGGADADTMVGGAGDDTYVVDNAGDTVTETANQGEDTVESFIDYTLGNNLENLTLEGSADLNGTGNDVANVLTGNSGDNVLDGQGGDDTMIGGLGNDTYVVDSTADVVTENANEGIDLVLSSATYTLSANVENLTLTGSAAINGTGNALANTITGNGAANTLDGGAGADTLIGGDGNDIYFVDSTADVVTENANEGIDLVQSSASFTLSANVEDLTLTGSAAINGTGNALANTITGNSGDNVLDGQGGADSMSGGLGNDTYIVDNVGDVVSEAGGDGIDLVQSSVTFTLGAGIENLTLTGSAAINGTGNDLGNTIIGNSGNNRLDGGTGIDALIGGAGNDTYVVDSTADVVTENASEGTDTVQSSATYTLSDNVENLTLTGSAAIDGTGNVLRNALIGNSGDNVLDGQGGSDTMTGGAGNDTYVVDSGGDVVVEAANEGAADLVQTFVTYTLTANVENLTLISTTGINGTGNDLANALTGNTKNNILDGGAGADTMIGGLGNDTYVVDNAGDIVTELDGQGTDTVQSSVTFSLLNTPAVERLTLTGIADIDGTGNGLRNILTGNAHDNKLDGGADRDTMIGGDGNDTYVVDNSLDVVTENLNEGTDTVESSVTYTLSDNVENLTLTGSAAINGTGNALENLIVGTSGNNVLNGGAGIDHMTGGDGNDTYVVDDTLDVVEEHASQGLDLVQSSASYTLSANVENLTLTGSAAIDGTGNTDANTIIGNSAANTLDGSVGADTLRGGVGDDTYIVDDPGDVVIEKAGEGTDLVQSSVTYTLSSNVENLALTGSAAIDGTGNTLVNTITGNGAANILNGGAGADTMIGGDGSDTYIVDNTNDTVTEAVGEGTADLVLSSATFTLSANVENLTLTGSADIDGTGNDLVNAIIGNSRANILNGGAGADTMTGGTGNDTYIVDDTNDTVVEAASQGTDTVLSSATYTLSANVENLTLVAGAGDINGTGNDRANIIIGNSGNNVIDGGAAGDTMIGGDGNDTYVVGSVSDVVTENENEGTDLVLASLNYTLTANVENLTLTGTSTFHGTGNELVNTITGNSGSNVLDGGVGADTMIGGLGNDTYVVDNSLDIVTELASQGTDLVQSSATYSLSVNVENLTLTGSDSINGTGNTQANILIGNTGDNVLDGGMGADTMKGGDGNDTYVVDNAADVVTENANEGSSDLVQSSVTYALSAEVENLTLTGVAAIDGTGNGLVNILTGNGAANTLDGGVGADTMIGGDGNDIYVVDNSSDVVTENANEGIDLVQSSATYILSAEVENLTLTGSAAIDGTGNGLVNILTGNGAANTLDGGAGADTMIGGDGNDIYVVDNSSDVVTENANEGIDLVQSSATYILSAEVENLTLTGSAAIDGTGNGLVNILTGNGAANTLDGGAGADTMIGGDGNDIYVVDNSSDVVTENANEGIDLVQSSATYVLSAEVENLTLTGSAAIDGTGNGLVNTLTGNGAANTLDGGAGADTMIGGDGNDIYVVDNSSDVVTENANEGIDLVQSSATYILSADVENLTLTGSAAIDGTGNAVANTITGNSGDNVLDGGAGDDTMIGGAGSDTYYVDSSADVVTETAAPGTDQVYASASFVLSDNVENLTLTGSADIDGTGNGAANVLTGNDGANVLDGGAGADIMAAGLGNDTYLVDNAGDVVTENADAGIDTVQSSINYSLGANLENLTLTGDATDGTGNDLSNVITGNGQDNTLDGGADNDTLVGNDGADVLMGGTGNDILSGGADNDTLLGGSDDDHLIGGTGADFMLGGSGNDTYEVDNAGDSVSESSNQGNDTVEASISYTLGANVENLTLTGTANLNGGGNILDNTVTGNDGDNIIDGKAGNDILTGGAGDDIFIFSGTLDSSTNVDQITDFSVADDLIGLSHSIFSAIDVGMLSEAAFHIGTAADDAAQRIIYNDTTGALTYDADGSGSGAAVQFATLSPALSLDHNHFVVA